MLRAAMKLLKRIALVVLVLLLLGVAGAFLFLDSIVRSAIEKGGTTAAGVPTTLDKADASIFSGQFGLEGFAIANPSLVCRTKFSWRLASAYTSSSSAPQASLRKIVWRIE